MPKTLTLILISLCFSFFPSKAAEVLPSIQAPPYEKVVVAVILTDQGLFNLNIAVNFEAPATIAGRMSAYTLDTYKAYLIQLDRLWKKRVFNIINKEVINISKLWTLKNEIEKALLNLTLEEKSNYKIESNTNVIFTITHFYLTKI